MDRSETLRTICERYAGERYDSPDVAAGLHADGVDWSQYYPEVDTDGLLTGAIVDSDTPGEYANVADSAMVAIDCLPRSERRRIAAAQEDGTWDGYAELNS
jgi:hypothetical protein